MPAGERGEIHVRGEQVSGEYLGRGSNLGSSDGWFPTRDGGWLDDEGFLFLEGRIDDIIVRGGENMSPGEIEDVLLEHEAVADCAVVGVPTSSGARPSRRSLVLKQGSAGRRRAPELGEGAPALLARARAHRVLRRAALQRDSASSCVAGCARDLLGEAS